MNSSSFCWRLPPSSSSCVHSSVPGDRLQQTSSSTLHASWPWQGGEVVLSVSPLWVFLRASLFFTCTMHLVLFGTHLNEVGVLHLLSGWQFSQCYSQAALAIAIKLCPLCLQAFCASSGTIHTTICTSITSYKERLPDICLSTHAVS